MPKSKYYFNAVNSKPTFQEFSLNRDKGFYHVYYGEWDSLNGKEKQYIGKKIAKSKLTSKATYQALKDAFIEEDANVKSIKIYYAAQDRIDTLYLDLSLITDETYNDYHQNKLHLAVKAKNLNMIKEILSESLELLNRQDIKGYTPLHYAVASGEVDTVLELISAGANYEIPVKMSNTNNNVKPLDLFRCVKEEGIRLLGEIKQSPEITQALSELFASSRSDGIHVTFKKDNEGKYRIIESLHIDSTSSSGYGGSGLEVRHRIADSWAKKQLRDLYIGYDYREVMQQLYTDLSEVEETERPIVINTIAYPKLLNDWYYKCYSHAHKQTEETSLLFAAAKDANQAKGWLLSMLQKNGSEFAAPFTIDIPNTHVSWFKSDDCSCDIKNYVNCNTEMMPYQIQISDKISFYRLWQLAVIDDENFARDNAEQTPITEAIARGISFFKHNPLIDNQPIIDISQQLQKKSSNTQKISPQKRTIGSINEDHSHDSETKYRKI